MRSSARTQQSNIIGDMIVAVCRRDDVGDVKESDMFVVRAVASETKSSVRKTRRYPVPIVELTEDGDNVKRVITDKVLIAFDTFTKGRVISIDQATTEDRRAIERVKARIPLSSK